MKQAIERLLVGITTLFVFGVAGDVAAQQRGGDGQGATTEQERRKMTQRHLDRRLARLADRLSSGLGVDR